MTVEPGTRLWTPRELDDRYGMSPGTVRQWIYRGHVRSVKVGRRHHVPDAERQRLDAAVTEPASA
jgi:hypothetical protein